MQRRKKSLLSSSRRRPRGCWLAGRHAAAASARHEGHKPARLDPGIHRAGAQRRHDRFHRARRRRALLVARAQVAQLGERLHARLVDLPRLVVVFSAEHRKQHRLHQSSGTGVHLRHSRRRRRRAAQHGVGERGLDDAERARHLAGADVGALLLLDRGVVAGNQVAQRGEAVVEGCARAAGWRRAAKSRGGRPPLSSPRFRDPDDAWERPKHSREQDTADSDHTLVAAQGARHAGGEDAGAGRAVFAESRARNLAVGAGGCELRMIERQREGRQHRTWRLGRVKN